LARNLADFRLEIGELRRKATIVAGLLVAAYLVWRLATRKRRRG
jgi:hypothetical protein